MSRLFVLCLLLCPALFGGERFTVDLREGNIDGKQALMDIPKAPVLYKEDLTNCRVLLAPAQDLEQRLSYPCGTWYIPPAEGHYVTWLETDVAISNPQGVLYNVDAPYRGSGLVSASPLVPAGYARVQTAVPRGHTVRYLHLDSPGFGFQLRVAGQDAATPVRIPEGRVVAGIFDREGRATAHSRPLTITATETTTFQLEPPEVGADLVVVLRKSRTHRARTADLEAGGRLPDVQYEKDTHLVAAWYGLPPVATTIHSATLGLHCEVPLEEGAVATVREEVHD